MDGRHAKPPPSASSAIGLVVRAWKGSKGIGCCTQMRSPITADQRDNRQMSRVRRARMASGSYRKLLQLCDPFVGILGFANEHARERGNKRGHEAATHRWRPLSKLGAAQLASSRARRLSAAIGATQRSTQAQKSWLLSEGSTHPTLSLTRNLLQ